MSRMKKSPTAEHIVSRPKKTRQGQGTRSKANHGRKKLRGQGRG